jgi:hypothetical protein
MKKINWFIFTFMAFAIFACDDDEEILDSTAPTINITAPTDGEDYTLGEGDLNINIAFTVMDDLGLEEVTLSVMRPDGTTAELENWDVNDFLNDNTEVSEEFTLVLPNNTPEGDYTIMVDATDESGNTASQESVTVTIIGGGTGEPGEPGISVEGIEEGQTLNTLGGAEGVPATFNFTGEEGIDSVNVSARRVEDDREIFNRGFNQAFFDENNIDNTGDFSFQNNLRFPNTSLARGASNLTVRSFRGGQMVGERTVNTNLEPAEGTQEVAFNATPATVLPEGSRVFTSGNFTAGDEFSRIDDPGFELMEDINNPGTFGTTVFADPNRDVNFRFSRMDADGVSSFEVDENCQELGQDSRTFSPATDAEAGVNTENVRFRGVDCE